MISKRYQRSYQPQENLRQFSLNNSKGIDETRSITDSETVLDMENLTVNADGSLSLRKRLQPAYAHGGDGEVLAVLYTGKHVFVRQDSKCTILNRASDGTLSEAKVNIKCKDYYNYQDILLNDWILDNSKFDFRNPSFVNTDSSTVIGNCRIKLSALADATNSDRMCIDSTLYSANSEWVPRYLQIVKESETSDEFTVRIVNPELNTLSSAEGDIALNPNMTLDFPYAVRDTYGNTVPSVSGILMYTTKTSFTEIGKDNTETIKNESFKEKVLFKTTPSYLPISFNEGRKELEVYATGDSNDAFSNPKVVVENPYTLPVKLDFTTVLKCGTSDILNEQFVKTSTRDTAVNNTLGTLTDNFTNVSLTVPAKSDGVVEYQPKFENNDASYLNGYYEPPSGLRIRVQHSTLGGVSYTPVAAKYVVFSQHVQDTYTYVYCECVLESGKVFRNAKSYFMTDTIKGQTSISLTPDGSNIYNEAIVIYLFKREGDLYISSQWKGMESSDWETPNAYLTTPSRIVGIISEWASRTYSSLPYLDSVSDVTYSTTEDTTVASTFYENRVSKISETDVVFKPVSVLARSENMLNAVVKAFGNYSNMEYYATWDYSLDGISWDPYGRLKLDYAESVEVNVVNELYSPPKIEAGSLPTQDELGHDRYVTRTFYKFNPGDSSNVSLKSDTSNRVDVLPLALVYNAIRSRHSDAVTFPIMLRFSIVTLRDKQNDAGISEKYIEATVASKIWQPTFSAETEYLESDMPNAVLGEKMYYKKVIYSYGSDYNGIAYVSDANSFVTPLYNVLELGGSAGSIVHQILPWRNYLISFTSNSVHLSSRQSDGFFTKTVSTQLGIPYSDRHCAKPILNGIIMKSGSKIYYTYPNLYASDDSTLIVTDISKPVSHILADINEYTSFYADVIDDDKYVLLCYKHISNTHNVKCLVYNISTKLWEVYTYEIPVERFFKDVYGTTTAVCKGVEYTLFEEDLTTKLPRSVKYTLTDIPDRTYYDILKQDDAYIAMNISFMLDTGQKTDSISNTKQFVESKLVFATLDDRDAFPFTTYVAIDGDPHVVTTDVSTDAPFWKTENSKGFLGTAFRLGEDSPASGAFNTLRQFVIRYSGKGKSIRHVIEGESLCNFKMYETYVRYKNLNVK